MVGPFYAAITICSPYHTDCALCGTCRAVSSPLFTGQPDGTLALSTINTSHPTMIKTDILVYESGEGNQLTFASELRTIIRLKNKANLDFFASLDPLFTTGLSPRGRTVFEGISQLEEGSHLEYRLLDKTFRKEQCFSLADSILPELNQELSECSLPKLLDKYEGAFARSLEKHLISNAPPGSLFSAGLESSVVKAFTLKQKNIDFYHFESESVDLLKYP